MILGEAMNGIAIISIGDGEDRFRFEMKPNGQIVSWEPLD